MSLELRMLKVATIQRATSPGVFATLSTVVGHLTPLGGSEEVDGRNVVVTAHKFRFPFGVDLTERDQLVIDSKTYNILRIDNAAGANRHSVAELRGLR